MPKKSFKDNPALAFIGNQATEVPPTKETSLPPPTPTPAETNQRYYRINLKLNAEYKDYLQRVSWDNRKSVTRYINDLIAADKERQQN